MKILAKYILFLICVFAFCPQSFGSNEDCEVAITRCHDQCALKRIYDYQYEVYVEQTNFLDRCQSACRYAYNWCNMQDNQNSCGTFDAHCVTNCPWSVSDNYTEYSYTDSFKHCLDACAGGTVQCMKKINTKTVPERKRTGSFEGSFDICGESQSSCYSRCMGNVPRSKSLDRPMWFSNFPDMCAQACAQGMTTCKTAQAGATQCDVFSNDCEASCSDTILDSSGNVYATDPFIHGQCAKACREGRNYCRDLLYLPVDIDLDDYEL